MSGVNKGLLAMLAGVGTGAGAFGSPEEAEAYSVPWLRKSLIRNYYDIPLGQNGFRPAKSRPRMFAGTFEPGTWETVSRLYPGVPNRVFVSPHPLETRYEKAPFWSLRTTINRLEHMLNAPKAEVVNNYNRAGKKGGVRTGGTNAPYLLKYKVGDQDVFYPFIPNREKTGFYVASWFPPHDSQLRRATALAQPGGGVSSSSTNLSPARAAPVEQHRRGYNGYAVAGSQPSPLSDVKLSQSKDILGEQTAEGNRKRGAGRRQAFGTSMADMLNQAIKNKGGALAGASGAALSHYGAEPEPAHAFSGEQAYTGKPDLPLESPWLDPVDIITAPIGVPGSAAKALSMAMAPAFNYGMEKLGGLLGMLASDEERQN